LRKQMTPHERAVWRLLREGELVALNWRRQSVFRKYILDFVSHPARLVVEVDGAQHGAQEQAGHDEQRTAVLNGQGYRVLRFWNNEAMRARDGVWRTVHAAALETPARARMVRWREKHVLDVAGQNAHLPLDGGGGREAAGGGARVVLEEEASRGNAGNAGGPHPISHASRDSSSIEGERGAWLEEEQS
jgi:very-short-patch-repair endonuclease